ncbi:DUF3131 domain-containing protein [Rubellimicrobium roseum]|uniref:DUF3131 domain-containing protein n=1 Tax=Rubellimicrobium roseum TaxID=687525 RepID=UPI00159BA4F6|nr:DUF3131 domain-containing protein [Rubellimicrobium roseum]
MNKIVSPPLVAIVLALGPGPAAPPLAAEGHWPDRPLSTVEPVASPRRGPLTEAEMAMARNAWRYFEANWQPDTGLTNAVNAFPSTTLWDTGSYIAALVSVHGLGIIEEDEARERLDLLLGTLSHLQLFRTECPNKVYHTQTAYPTDYRNEPGQIGCSALDIARLMVWLKVIEQRYPEFQPDVRRTLRRWNWCNLVTEAGVLQGSAVAEDGSTRYLQEGRLGYEEYGAAALALWGFGVEAAYDPEPYSTIWLYGVEVPYDSRDPRTLGAHNYVVTESYALLGLEFGFADPEGAGIPAWIARAAQNVYEAQARRFDATGVLTARTEHQLLESPYFVYDTVFSDGRPWATITDTGRSVPEHAAVALKGALGLWALWDTAYTDRLFEHIAPQFDPGKGYVEGIYEDGRGPIAQYTANNNGIMLETLFFKVNGPILQPVENPAAWVETADSSQNRCLPGTAEPVASGG